MKTILLIITGILMILSACQKTVIIDDDSGKDCKLHTECMSGVCSFYKKDNGKCEKTHCTPGEKTDNNNFYCDENEKWQKSKQTGENCVNEYECFKQTCFMIPDCQMTDIPLIEVSCKGKICFSNVKKDDCEAKGIKRVLKKEEFMIDTEGNCYEKIVQRELKTVCADCGNGNCESEVESKCNCKEDCH